MKKILEVLQYGENDIRFNTDIDVEKTWGKIARAMSDALEAFRKDGGKVLSFSPGIQPPKTKS